MGKRKGQPARVEIPITGIRVKNLRQALRRDWHWRLRAVSAYLGISHTMLILVEKNKRHLNAEASEKFLTLERDWRRESDEPDLPTETVVVSRFALPDRFEVLAKPRKCDRCGEWFVPSHPRQLRHQRPCGNE